MQCEASHLSKGADRPIFVGKPNKGLMNRYSKTKYSPSNLVSFGMSRLNLIHHGFQILGVGPILLCILLLHDRTTVFKF